MTIWHSSDFHLLHRNVLAYCPGRLDLVENLNVGQLKLDLIKFKDNRAEQRKTIEANEDLMGKAAWDATKSFIKKWNAIVAATDEVFCYGDVCMGNLIHSIPFISQLNGKIFLLEGNHDKKALKNQDFRDRFEWIKSDHEEVVGVSGRQITIKMRHFPPTYEELTIKEDGQHRKFRPNLYHVFGHRHGNVPHNPKLPCLDVGIDAQNLLPVSQEKLIEHISTFLNHLDAGDAPVPIYNPAENDEY